jgi:hypothetical protein
MGNEISSGILRRVIENVIEVALNDAFREHSGDDDQ